VEQDNIRLKEKSIEDLEKIGII